MKNKKYPETTIVYTDGPLYSCKYEKLDLNPDTFILNLNTIKVGQDDKQETFDLVKLFRNIDSLSKNKFEIFLEVLKECEIKTGYDFMHFMSVIQEHCIDKNITDYEEVKKIWEEHKDSLKKSINSIQFPEFNDNLLEEFDKEFFENGQDDDNVGDWRENTVFTNEIDDERVEACKDIFEGIDKVKVEKE